MSLTTTELLGPLTTQFKPPTACLATATYNPSGIWAPDYSKSLSPAVLYGATGQAPDLVCYPPKFTIDHVYSPGICPKGWTSACEPTNGATSLFAAPTKGVQCCPSGFHCSDFVWCIQEPTPTARPVWSVWQGKWGIEGVMTSSAFPDMKAMAKPIFVAYQSSDKDVLASATLSSSVPTPTGASGSSLSGGTIAGIVVGSAAGGILAAVLFFFALWCCLGFRFTRSRGGGPMKGESHHELAAKEASAAAQYDSQPPAQPPSQRKVESPGWSASELPSAGQTTVELDTSATHGRSELAEYRDSNP